jgi:ATPase subunit of ABC transporter with duplicated ATPase domains
MSTMRMQVLVLLSVSLLILDASAFSISTLGASITTPGAISGRTFAASVNTRSFASTTTTSSTRLFQSSRINSVSSVSTKKKGGKNKNTAGDEIDVESSSAPGLPPALILEGLTCSHDGGNVFQLKDVSYMLPRQSKVGLVGRNGCGKSTLMKILAELTCTDRDPSSFNQDEGVRYTGKVECPKDIRVAFVEQEPPSPNSITVADALLGVVSDQTVTPGQASKSVYEAVRRYTVAVSNPVFDEDEFGAASAEMDVRDGWSVLTKADEIATRMRVDHLKDMPLSKLSGGERKRVALGAALVQSPDVLLLDEPVRSYL